MKEIFGEYLITVVKARRKGRSSYDRTEFELGIGYVVDEKSKPTGQIRLRTEQIASGVAPVVATIELETAKKLFEGLQEAIKIAEKSFPPG